METMQYEAVREYPGFWARLFRSWTSSPPVRTSNLSDEDEDMPPTTGWWVPPQPRWWVEIDPSVQPKSDTLTLERLRAGEAARAELVRQVLQQRGK
jgi:hypothetical protein